MNKTLAKRPEDRFQTSEELMRAIESLVVKVEHNPPPSVRKHDENSVLPSVALEDNGEGRMDTTNPKRILIVDDEPNVAMVLAESLEKLGDEYVVETAIGGEEALGKVIETSYDVVITDYKMPGMDGLELLDSIRSMQPQAKVILMTAYSSDVLEAEARRLQAYGYLAKPFDVNVFGKRVQDALNDVTEGCPGILILSNERYHRVHKLLEKLRLDVGARCMFLTDAGGRSLACVGDVEDLPFESIASLLGGGISTLFEVGRALDGDSEAINLVYREGKRECLYASNVGQNLLLILLIDRTSYSTRLGSVWYYTQQATVELRQIVDKAEYASPQQVFGDFDDDEFGQELDKLFTGD